MKTLTRFLPGGRTAGLIVALTMTAALAACSSSSDSDSAGSAGSSDAGSGSESAAVADRPASSDSLGGPVTDVSSLQEPPVERKVISHGSVSLTSDDVAGTRREVQRIVDGQDGTITQESTETDDKGVESYSRLVIRVPAGAFTTTFLALEKSGDLRSSQIKSDDVTTQVIDTAVRVRAQEGSLRRVEQLLARARSLKDIIWIESQLTRRQAELDSLKSQQAWLSDQTSESTITVDIERTHEAAAKHKDDDAAGFLAGLRAGTKALGGFASTMATIVGALLPFALVLAIFGVPVWLLVRRSARRHPRPTATG